MSRESHASRLQSHSLLALGEQLTEETSSLRSFARSGQILVVSCECEGPIDWGTMLVDGGKGGSIKSDHQCICSVYSNAFKALASWGPKPKICAL